MTAHARLSASSAYRWVACPGSVLLIESLPEAHQDTGSSFAQEGTAAHALLEACLLLGIDASDYLETLLEGIEVDEEMVSGVQVALDTVKAVLDAYPDAVLHTECRVSLRFLGRPDMFGTADVVIWSPSARVITVIDFKYGKGVVVEAKDNLQLGMYGLGAAFDVSGEDVERVDTWIVQPRAWHADGPVRGDTMNHEALPVLGRKLLRAAEATEDPKAPLVAGEHCRFCPASPVCPAKAAHAQSVTMTAFDGEVLDIPAPEKLDHETFLRALNAADQIEIWLKAVRAHAQRMLEVGEEIPGWKLVQRRAMRKWKDEYLVREWAVLTDDDLLGSVYESSLRSVAQVEKIAKKAGVDLPTELYEKVSSGVTMAPEHDTRPALPAASPFTALLGDGVTDFGSDGE